MFAMCTPNIKYEPYDHSEEVPLCQKKLFPSLGGPYWSRIQKGLFETPSISTTSKLRKKNYRLYAVLLFIS